MDERFASLKTVPGPGVAAPTPVAAADPDLVPGAVGPAKVEAAARAAAGAAHDPGWQHLAHAADPEAKRAKLKVRRRMRSAVRRTRMRVGAEAQNRKRAKRRRRRAKRMFPVPRLAPNPDPSHVLNLGPRIAPGSLVQRDETPPGVTLKGAIEIGCPAPDHGPLWNPNPGLDLSPGPSLGLNQCQNRAPLLLLMANSAQSHGLPPVQFPDPSPGLCQGLVLGLRCYRGPCLPTLSHPLSQISPSVF